jgi:hypothetical protein
MGQPFVLAFLFPLQKAQSAWPYGGDLKGAAAEPNCYGLRSPVKPSDASIFIFHINQLVG